jgi:hypothetical protein
MFDRLKLSATVPDVLVDVLFTEISIGLTVLATNQPETVSLYASRILFASLVPQLFANHI